MPKPSKKTSGPNIPMLIAEGAALDAETKPKLERMEEIKKILRELPDEAFQGADGRSFAKKTKRRVWSPDRAFQLFGKKVTKRVPDLATAKSMLTKVELDSTYEDGTPSISFGYTD